MVSLKTPFRWLLQPLFVAPLGQCEANAADLVTFRFLAWRRKVLVLVLVVTGLTAAIDTVFKQLREPRPTLTILIKLGTESEPAQQTLFGDIADQFWLLSFYAMPASALLAAICWARPRASRPRRSTAWSCW